MRADERRRVRRVLQLSAAYARASRVDDGAREVARTHVPHVTGLQCARAVSGRVDVARIDIELLNRARDDEVGPVHVAGVPDAVACVGARATRAVGRCDETSKTNDGIDAVAE